MRQAKFPETLEEQARVFGYQRSHFKKDWEITLPISVREAFQTAAYLARVEGKVEHAYSIEVRLPSLTQKFKYTVGSLKNGCRIVYVAE